MRLKRPAPEEQFLYESKGNTTKTNNEPPPSPLSKKVYFLSLNIRNILACKRVLLKMN